MLQRVMFDTRYRAETAMLRDENSGLSGEARPVARKNFRLLVGDRPYGRNVDDYESRRCADARRDVSSWIRSLYRRCSTSPPAITWSRSPAG